MIPGSDLSLLFRRSLGMAERHLLVTLLATAVCLTSPPFAGGMDQEASTSFSSDAINFFEKKIRPLLAERCYECHSKNSGTIEAGLRLDSRNAMLSGGETGPAIVPGEPDQSLLIESIHYGGTYEMPPDSKLPAEEIKLLNEWVKMGAPWPTEEEIETIGEQKEAFSIPQRKENHWCWQPLKLGPVPAVQDHLWPREDIDYFILSRLEEAGLEPANAASRNQWIRRVTFDLTGLPPTVDEINQFLSDFSPVAYERVVDRLLASPRFGEHWARYWMDIIRYGETKAFAQDYSAPFVFRYRDYLIRAYNADVAYDQFIREALAGDLIEKPRVNLLDESNESVMGPGYVYLTDGHHGPADIHADEARVFDTIIDTTSKAFLALTLSCCRCHDHKFDALSMQDYYSLYGVIASSRIDYANTVSEKKCAKLKSKLAEEKKEVRNALISHVQNEFKKIDFGSDAQCMALCETLAKDEAWRKKNHPLYPLTSILLASDAEARTMAWNELKQSFPATENSLGSTMPGLASPSTWFASGIGFDREQRPPGTIIIAPEGNVLLNAIVGSSWVAGDLTSRLAGSLKSPTFQLPKKIRLRVQGRHGRVRLYIQHYEMVGQGPTTTSLDIAVNKDAWHWISFDTRLWEGKRAYLEVLQNGDQMQFVSREQHKWSHEEDGYLAIDQVILDALEIPEPKVNLATASWGIAGDPPEDLVDATNFFANRIEELLEQWKAGTVDRGGEEILAALFAAGGLWEVISDEPTPLRIKIEKYRKHMQSIPKPTYARSLTDGPGADEAMHIRGNPAAPTKEAAKRHFLDAIDPQPFTEWGSGREKWADAAVVTGMPLTARVEVNRIWYRLFGRGIVESIDNFGVKGTEPSHPHLLDSLAENFVRSGWSRKALIRKIVLSNTYRMSTDASPKALAIDPDNVLLQHAAVRRLPAEAIRDAILATSGSLNSTMYGPGVPLNLNQMPPSRARPLKSGPLDGNRRRAIYQEMRRNYLPPLLLAFDLPQAAVALGKRGVTNVPAQSLALLNDPFIIQEAQRWADQILDADNLSTKERIDLVHQIAFSRPATEKEIVLARHMLNYFEEHSSENDEQYSASRKAWQSLCHLMFNRKEFIFVR